MAYFNDLSEYTYDLEFARPGTITVGWLDREHSFRASLPSDEILTLLWTFCSTSVALTRGLHACEFCPSGSAYFSERNGKRLLLGAAEIRVFSDGGRIYAAPNLIYHYVLIHHYQPPEEFVKALCKGPQPPNQEYFECLEKLGLKWQTTSSGEGLRRPHGT
jgi:hypothetical protein